MLTPAKGCWERRNWNTAKNINWFIRFDEDLNADFGVFCFSISTFNCGPTGRLLGMIFCVLKSSDTCNRDVALVTCLFCLIKEDKLGEVKIGKPSENCEIIFGTF